MISTYRYQTTKVRKWFHPEDTSTFISGYKLMAYGRFFFLHEIVMNVKICYSMFESSWDLALVTFRTPMVTSWMVTVWYQSVFKVFQGPIFFTLLTQFLSSPEFIQKTATEGSKDGLLHYIQEMGYFQSSSCPVLQLPFSKMSCISPKQKGFRHVRFSVSFTSSLLLGFLFCLVPCSMSFSVQSRILWLLSKTLP